MVLKCPATVKLKTLDRHQTKELDILMELYWLKWKITIYDYLQLFGIAPWYWKKLRGTNHYIPKCPPIMSGYFTTYIDSSKDQQYRFYYFDDEKYVSSMYFEIKGHGPTVKGDIVSPVSTILADYRTSKILREAVELAWHQQARMQHVFEHHPQKNIPADDNLVTLESFGEEIAGVVQAQQEGLRASKMQIRRSDMQNALLVSSFRNKIQKQRFGTNKYLRNEKDEEEWERNNASLLERGIALNADFVYKPVPAPQIQADYTRIMQRLDHLSSAIMDIPLNFVENTGSRTTTANIQGSMRFVNERIKDWIKFFERLTKKAFLINYGNVIQDELDKKNHNKKLKPEQLISIYADQEVDVYMECSPIANVSDLRQAYYDGMIKKEDVAHHIFNVLGIPKTDIHISEFPDKYPKDLGKEIMMKNLKTPKDDISKGEKI